ncbi:tRNA lysidine(34) synthetase TilS [Nitrincola tibetensis]|uniref:tRNA(Ile)-lysidine synthase n=1 Tax=Nitrincola tibetensis TaxID=2219697 RepID=A0A364NJB6_9GAMM|nr:tRNA lysidine(34) synthetase TilS [Nitrincola tibetensis]RAU17153.1 tRNA lysidine(34) synthetase TilS [Nitrincola tibetensis]
MSPVVALQALAKANPDIRRWVIAYSGGLDSEVLLSAATQAFPVSTLLAIHVNHQLQENAAGWSEHCRKRCAELNVAFVSVSVSPLSSSELDARNARYQAFADHVYEGDVLLMAHHADDQAETLLYRLVRGAGVRGLAAIPFERSFCSSKIIRPFLSMSRKALEAWAYEQRLTWVDDPSNKQDDYARNYIRLRVLPELQKRWPQVVGRLAKTASYMSEADKVLVEVAQGDLQTLLGKCESIDVLSLLRLSIPRQHNVLRYWVKQQGGELDESSLQTIRKQLLCERPSSSAYVQISKTHRIGCYRQNLFYLPLSLPSIEVFERQLDLVAGTYALETGILTVEGESLDIGSVKLVYRQGGERLRPLGRGGSVSLKQLLQEKGIPPWWRENWPLLMMDTTLVAVPSVCFTDNWPNECNLRLIWHPFGLSEEPFFATV